MSSKSKGFSSIVGAVFAVLVMISLTSTVFVWSLSQNTLYNSAVTQTRQADLDRSNEKIVANVTCLGIPPNTVSVNGTLENDGPLSTEIVTLWVTDTDPTTNKTTYASKSSLSMTLTTGNVTTLAGPTAINVTLANSAADSLSCWFITGRGNIIYENGVIGGTIINYPTYYNDVNTTSSIINNAVYYGNVTINNSTIVNGTFPSSVNGSMVSQGIGSIAMNFSAFWHYDFSNKPADGTLLPSRTKANYTVSQNNYTIFHVVLADYDPEGKNITLDSNSSIYIIGSHQSTVKWAAWTLVNVTNGKIYPSQSNFKVNLILGVQTELYFAGSVTTAGIDSGYIYPLNIMAFGKKGGDDYGQNIPFVSVFIVN